MFTGYPCERVSDRLLPDFLLHLILPSVLSSRKSFTPPDHWLVTSQIDVQPFVEAALLDGQQLSAAVEALPGRNRARGGNARTLTKRQVAALSPRLGVLNNIPFAIPFDVRVSVFRGWVARDMIERAGGEFDLLPELREADYPVR